MEQRRGTWMAHGTSRRFLSRVMRPDDNLMRDMILNLMAIVGFIFLALVLLHFFYGLETNYSFHVYIVIFLTLESTVIFVRFYLRKRRQNNPLSASTENVQEASLIPEEKCQARPSFFSSYTEPGIKIQGHRKQNSV